MDTRFWSFIPTIEIRRTSYQPWEDGRRIAPRYQPSMPKRKINFDAVLAVPQCDEVVLSSSQ